MDPKAFLRIVRPAQPEQPLLLELDLARGAVSRQPSDLLEAFRRRHAPTLRDIRDGLHKGAKDPGVAGLVVHVGNCPLSPDQIDEIGELIGEFGQSKPTVAWSETFGELTNALLAYRLASFAKEIWLQPSGALGILGITADITLVRGTLEKLGLEPQFGQRKEFKSAAETFAGTEVSDANREMIQRIADSILEDTIDGVAERRHLDPKAVRLAVDNAPLTAIAARDARLIDRIGYRDEVYAELRSRFSETRADGPHLGLKYVHRYNRAGGFSGLDSLLSRKKDAIGVVTVQGNIVTGFSEQRGTSANAGSDTVAAHLREAARDDAVKAVVLRVDSGGGSYIASDMIRREVVQLREAGKPVIASMGQAAASGGYFVAMAADKIVANPTTLTGSIGVLAGKFVTTQLVDKIGLIREQILAGANAGAMSGFAPFDKDQWANLNAWLDEVYADFTMKAANDRGLELADLEAVAKGRVWTGSDARRHRLVDELGGMGKALEMAASAAGTSLDRVQVRAVPQLPWLEQIRPPESSESGSIDGGAITGAGMTSGSPEARLAALARFVGLDMPAGVLALPWRIDIR